MFAMSAEGIGIVIGAVFIGLVQMLTLILQYFRERDQKERDAAVAARVEEVRTQAVVAAKKVEQVRVQAEVNTGKVEEIKVMTTAQNKVLDAVIEKVEQVHLATNSLTDRLVASTDKEASLRGAAEERERARIEAKENQ